MSEINNSQGAGFPENTSHGSRDQQKEEVPQGISFKGEQTDLRFDPRAAVNKTYMDKVVKAKIGDFDVKFGSNEIKQVKKDLEQLYKNPVAVQKATALYPAFLGFAKKKGYKNPDALGLALENYAATNEFIKKSV
ncbi:MAG: hypothetical protein A2Y25_02450 [Candidatus Melainabacteria bacterium GWF2_37_15]|nr:MAG: hypothetical protein A2Y25_02450 [Candidatus Melainabacteria bacterium GWF2_37_15]